MNTTLTAQQNERQIAHAKGEKLAAEITELSSYIYAATSRLLTLIHEFDKNSHWEYLGMASCAHWLNFQCGIGMHAAREKVRVANALADFPNMTERFQRGELSYSKVRAMTRIATKENEDYLLMIARHGTANDVEKLVSRYSYCKRLQDTGNANKQHRARELSCRYDENGCLILKARLPAEQGALIMKALEMAMESIESSIDVPAGTPPNSQDPYLSHIENAPHIPAETSRRIACDCTRIELTEDETGEPLSIGRKSRSIPPSINRALHARDQGCRFPGCTNTHFIDGRHNKHWADGGETSMENLVQLCRRHHRLVREGGFGRERGLDGKLVFKDQLGKELARSFRPKSVLADQEAIDWMKAHIPNLKIDADTCVPLTTAGERMDMNLAVGHLFG